MPTSAWYGHDEVDSIAPIARRSVSYWLRILAAEYIEFELLELLRRRRAIGKKQVFDRAIDIIAADSGHTGSRHGGGAIAPPRDTETER